MKPTTQKQTFVVESPEQAAVLIHPLRAEIIAQLKDPSSATEVAKELRETPQRINYHLKALEKVGLVNRVGTRQVRNLIEVLYQSIARSFLLAESLSLGESMIQKIKDQGSLLHLIHTSERIKRDVLMLMEKVDQADEIPSASLQMKIHLKNEQQRKLFIQDYVALVKELVSKYDAKSTGDEAYQVLLAIYPELSARSVNEDES